jgi:hypothetical protein
VGQLHVLLCDGCMTEKFGLLIRRNDFYSLMEK